MLGGHGSPTPNPPNGIEVVELAKDCKAWANCAVFPIAIGEEWSGEVVVAEFGTYNDLWRGSEADNRDTILTPYKRCVAQ